MVFDNLAREVFTLEMLSSPSRSQSGRGEGLFCFLMYSSAAQRPPKRCMSLPLTVHTLTHRRMHTHLRICRQSGSEGTLLMGLFLMSQEEESDPSKVNISISLFFFVFFSLCGNVGMYAISTHTHTHTHTLYTYTHSSPCKFIQCCNIYL